jgi:uncharacterized protein with beta-barrel porin domain
MRKLRLVVAALAATLFLSSCSMIPGLGSQTGIQACAAVSDSMQKAASTFSSALTSAANDPKAASVALDQLITDITASRAKVTNADVGAAMDKATAAIKKLSDEFKAAGGNPTSLNSDKVSAATDEVSQAMQDFATACTKI